jgi:hypothetical protein
MLNNTILGCLNTMSMGDQTIVMWWKYIAITLACMLFTLLVGIFLGACAYRARMKRIATDPDVGRVDLDDDETQLL